MLEKKIISIRSIFRKINSIFQLEEIFTLQLHQYNNHTVTIGSRLSIILKVTENERPHGVVQFRNTSIITAISNMLSIKSIFRKLYSIFQLEEIFTLQLHQYNNHTVTIGSRSSIILKVTENERPHGVVQFRNTSIITAISKLQIHNIYFSCKNRKDNT